MFLKTDTHGSLNKYKSLRYVLKPVVEYHSCGRQAALQVHQLEYTCHLKYSKSTSMLLEMCCV